MFALRGIAISFSIFVLLYGAMSVTVLLSWRRMRSWGGEYSARRCADWLFMLRIIPFLLAAGATLTLAVPSFLLLEPRSVKESMSAVTFLLGFGGTGVLLLGIWNAAAAWLRSSRTVASWSSGPPAAGSSPLDWENSICLFRGSVAAPPLAAAGILRPAVWLSPNAELVLTDTELKAALRHEVVHVRRRDNLRKLILRAVAFPGMTELEDAWREAAEMAADDGAVSDSCEALDLASALIKISLLVPLAPPAELTTALVPSPAQSVKARVERLIAWTETRQRPVQRYSFRYALCAAAVVLATLVSSYSHLLVQVHTATEWLVR